MEHYFSWNILILTITMAGVISVLNKAFKLFTLFFPVNSNSFLFSNPLQFLELLKIQLVSVTDQAKLQEIYTCNEINTFIISIYDYCNRF